MISYKQFFVLIGILMLFAGLNNAQFVTSQPSVASNQPKESQSKEDFVSVEGGFTISLPQITSGYRSMTSELVKSGSQFTWNIPEGKFLITYEERPVLSKITADEFLESVTTKVTDEIAKDAELELINKKSISLNDIAGTEILLRYNKVALVITRYYVDKNRVYILQTGWAENTDNTNPLKILNSFKLIDREKLFAQKLAEATPQDLPQSPMDQRITTDVQDEQLKGKVKSVLGATEDLTGNWAVKGKKPSIDDFYSESGQRTKKVLYDFKGNPSTVAVYGFIDGARVSKAAEIRYEYNPPIMAMPLVGAKPNVVKTPEPIKPADSRYLTKYEYKYDENKRVKEIVRYSNNGQMSSKYSYIYDGNKVEESFFDREGKLLSKTIEAFDEKGNLIQKIFVHSNTSLPDTVYDYTYQTFDSQGNWTKRTINGKEGRMDGKFNMQNYIEYRSISYYP